MVDPLLGPSLIMHTNFGGQVPCGLSPVSRRASASSTSTWSSGMPSIRWMSSSRFAVTQPRVDPSARCAGEPRLDLVPCRPDRRVVLELGGQGPDGGHLLVAHVDRHRALDVLDQLGALIEASPRWLAAEQVHNDLRIRRIAGSVQLPVNRGGRRAPHSPDGRRMGRGGASRRSSRRACVPLPRSPRVFGRSGRWCGPRP